MANLSTFSLTAFPLSQIQQSNWFLHQLFPEGFTDKVSFALRIKAPVDIIALRNSFQTLIKRHPILRSTYGSDIAGNPIQKILDKINIKIEEINAANRSDDELNKQIIQLVQRPFDLENPPLIRVSLLKCSAIEYILLLTVHQIAGDWESLLILVDEFLTLYTSDLIGSIAKLPILDASYIDYVWQEVELLKSSEGKSLENYWKTQLFGELPVLNLPSNSSVKPTRSYNGLSYTFTVNKNLTQQLKDLAQTKGFTLEALLLAVFKVLLYRYTGAEDIIVALRATRNEQPKYEQIVGNISNVVVIKSSIDKDSSFINFVNQTINKISETAKYQEYPFPLLVKQLQQTLNLNRSPICQAAFAYYHLPYLKNVLNLFEAVVDNSSSLANGLEIEYLQIPQQKVDFDLNLELINLKESLLVSFKYNKDLLDADFVSQIADHYHNLLTAIAANPQQSITQLSLLSDRERNQLLVEGNATQREYDFAQSIHQLFEKQVERTPDKVAIAFDNKSLTYRELNNRANQLAHYLQKLSVKSETLVGICVERSLEMVVGLLAILKAGGAYVPLDPNYPPERLAYMLEDSQVSVLLTQEKFVAELPKHSSRVVCLDADWDAISKETQNNPVSSVTPDNLAYVIYTSGSTGKPKGVQICHHSLTNFLNSMRQAPGLTEQDIFLAVTTISFDIAALELYLPLIVGAKVVLVPHEVAVDGTQLKELLIQERATTMQATPATWRLLLAADWKGNPQLKILCGGEALPRELANKLLERCGSLWNMYGPTETTIWSTIYNVGENRQVARSKDAPELLGRPIANTQIYILDSHLQPVPVGVPGELYIGGFGLARGYLNRPDLTNEKFIPNPFISYQSSVISYQSPVTSQQSTVTSQQSQSKIQNLKSKIYKTGDLARYLPDGNIEYLGRIDNQVKIRGFRIELGDIENALVKHPDVQQAVVIARSESTQKQLVAYIVPKQEKPIPATLRTFLKQKLPDYMVPAAFVVLESLPLTPNGKIDRRALPAPDKSSYLGASFVAPRNAVEKQLAQIWSEILDIQPVGVKDNFFDLGGYSFLALKLMAKISQQFGKTLPLATLFTNGTIEELANIIQSSTYIPANSSLVPIQPKGNKQPFFCIHPAWGHVLCYQKLSHYLGKEQLFYGLQAQGFNEGEEPLTRVEDMASHYIKAIQTVQPEGPYQVGGWSFGGVVALEVAQQLHKMGQEVSLLALLDSYVPILLDKNKKIDDVYLVGVLSRVFGGMFGEDNLVTSEELKSLTIDEQIDYITDKAKKAKIFPPEVEGQNNRRIIDVLVGTLKATYAYQRQPYPGKVTVFRTREKHVMAPDPTLVWVELFAVLAALEINIINVPGNHYTFVLEPHIPILAEHLKACLSQT